MNRPLLALVALVLASCGADKPGRYLGYVEGESVHVAAPVAGQLLELHAVRGDTVEQNAPLFVLEQERDKAASEESTQRLNQAQAQLRLADAEYKRQQDLQRKGLTSASQLDAARMQSQTAHARIDELNAQIAQLHWVTAQKAVAAPVGGMVDDVYYRVGEQVPAGTPVLSLLPPQSRKLRFFVPQADLDRVRPGAKVVAHCDGCPAPIAATVRFIAPQAEYTPPVIYSESARQKLVFLVEAWPEAVDALKLRPGQPAEVEISSSSGTQ